jgi:hypothetical protein
MCTRTVEEGHTYLLKLYHILLDREPAFTVLVHPYDISMSSETYNSKKDVWILPNTLFEVSAVNPQTQITYYYFYYAKKTLNTNFLCRIMSLCA